MAKYLKQSQVKFGTTMFVVHPKFPWIEQKLVLDKPRRYSTSFLDCMKFSYLSVAYFTIVDGEAKKEAISYFGERVAQDGFVGDDGIPDNNGKFEYHQMRRAFPTLKKALEYWNAQQTEENLKAWAKEDARMSEW